VETPSGRGASRTLYMASSEIRMLNGRNSDGIYVLNGGAEGLDYGLWISRVARWDGLLPVIVSAVSVGVALLFPQNRDAQTIALLALPIAAFLYRAYIGRRQIFSNRCRQYIRWLQFVALGFALLLLLFFDFLVVLMAFIPDGPGVLEPEDVPIWAGMLGAYLALVIFAMYPGRGLLNPNRHR
jgi:hypothetical protein